MTRGEIATVARQDKGAANNQLTSLVVLGALVIVLVAGFVVLSATGRDTTSYTLFASGPIMTGIVGALLARRQDAIAADVATVVHQTNGALQAQFDAASVERQDLAGKVVDAVGQTVPAPPVAPRA